MGKVQLSSSPKVNVVIIDCVREPHTLQFDSSRILRAWAERNCFIFSLLETTILGPDLASSQVSRGPLG